MKTSCTVFEIDTSTLKIFWRRGWNPSPKNLNIGWEANRSLYYENELYGFRNRHGYLEKFFLVGVEPAPQTAI